MAGLLDSLDELLQTTNLAELVGEQAGQLGTVITAVEGLVAGPEVLTNLQGTIADLPTPPGLQGFSQLSGDLEGLTIPTEFSGALSPILAPLTGLVEELADTGMAGSTALFDLVRDILRLVTGRGFGGPSGMPTSQGFTLPDPMDLEEFQTALAEAKTVLADLGPRLDAVRILDFLRSGSAGFATPLIRFPQLPVLDETMEALHTIATWQRLSGDQLHSHLIHTLDMAATLIDTPRLQVAQPVIAAAQEIINGPATLATAVTVLTPLFTDLRSQVLSPTLKPTIAGLCQLESTTAALVALGQALDRQSSPLGRAEQLPAELTQALLVVVRTLQPAYDLTPLANRVRQLLTQLPTAPTDAFAEAVEVINQFDLGAVTGALQEVRSTVQSAVDTVNDAQASVRNALEALLSPVATGLDQALAAAGFEAIQAALASLPGDIDAFVNGQVRPAIEPIRSGISDTITTVSEAAEDFNPQALIAPIRNAVEQVAALLNSDAVRGAFAELDTVLTQVIQALENFDLAGAADESVRLIGEIETKVSAINPALIPDQVKPTLRQAVAVVTDIDFTHEVAQPVIAGIGQALVEGPQALLGSLEQEVDELRTRLTQFRPSAVIGNDLDRPFQDLVTTLQRFRPSDLLDQLQETLNGLAERVQVLDVEAVIGPLVALHAKLVQQIEALQPSVLLAPVNQAIAAAVEKVYEVSQIDTLFDGITDALAYIQSWTGLLADSRDLLTEAAQLFSQPGDAQAAVTTLVEEAVAQLDGVDLTRLQTAFDRASQATRANQRDAIAGPLARALQQAGQQALPLVNSPQAQQVIYLIRQFPLEAVRSHPPNPRQQRLLAALEQLTWVADQLQGAPQSWQTLAPRLETAAGNLQADLLDYYNLQQLNGGGVLSQFRQPPTTVAALKATVRDALRESLEAPVTTLVAVFQAFSPYLELLAQGAAQLLAAIHAKIDALIGDNGLGGTIAAVETAANLLRDLDLSPLTGPLDSLHQRLVSAVGLLDPEPLRAPLVAAQAAIGDLLQLSTLIDSATIDQLETTYANAVQQIGSLAPSQVIASTLDPVYADLLADFLPVLALPGRLRELTEVTGRRLSTDAVQQLARVETAFDAMLRAIPLEDSNRQVQGSVSVSVG